MDIAKKIALKIEERETHTHAMEKLLETAGDEARALTEEEQTDFDKHESLINSIDIEITNLERMEKAIASQKAQPVQPVVTNFDLQSPVIPRIETKTNQDPKLFLARMAHALYMNNGSRHDAAQYAKQLGDEEVHCILSLPAKVVENIQKAAYQQTLYTNAQVSPGTTTDPTWAGPLTILGASAEAFIEVLRPASIVARFPGRDMSFGGDNEITIPRQTGKAAGNWVGEGAPIKVGASAFDSIQLTPKKSAIIVPMTKELLAKSSPSALQLVSDDIVRSTAEIIDTKFVSADAEVTRVSPAGLLNGITGIASAGNTLANVDADSKAITNSLLSANVGMTRGIYLMSTTNLNSLSHLRDGGGGRAYPETLNGMWGGYPVLTSNTVGATSIILVDADHVIVASDYSPMIDLSEDATLVMEDTTPIDISSEVLRPTEANMIQSMFQHDQVALRLTLALDWARRHDEAVDHLTGVGYAS